MILEEFFKYRNELLDESKDEEGFIQENLILSQVGFHNHLMHE